MSLFTDDERINTLVNELSGLVTKRFYEVAKRDAKEIADELLEEYDLSDICTDIDDFISENADTYIHEDADANVINDFDNFLLATFEPYPENEEVDDYIVREAACSEEPSIFLEKAVQAYAYELWYNGIKNALKEYFEELCSKAGF